MLDYRKLRKKAEEIVAGRKQEGEDIRKDQISEMRSIFHELQVHQAELEMQNEELMNAQEELEKSRRKYAALFQDAPAGYATTDSRGLIRECNRTLSRWLGPQREDLSGKPFYSLLHPDFRDEMYKSIMRVAAGKTRETVEARLPDTGNGAMTVLCDTRWSEADEGIRIALLDVSERKLLEAGLERAQRLESLGVMAGGIAHDFNNALTAMMNNLAVARKTLEKGSDPSDALRYMEKAISSASALSNQLLTFAKGGVPVKCPVSLKPLLHDIVHMNLAGSNVEIVEDLPEDLWDVDADAGLLAQAIGNLVINAVQAMPHGGTLRVSARNIDVSKPNAGCPCGGPCVEMVFRDQGGGLTEEAVKRAFDPFYTTKATGSGLGLSASHSIVRKHGGELVVRNLPGGKGAEFAICLPAIAGHAGIKEEARMQHDAEEAGTMDKKICRVLLMDDDILISSSLQAGLQMMGCPTDMAMDGDEALDMFRKAYDEGEPYRVLVLDLTVRGGMGGLETLIEARKTDPSVKAVVSSGYSDDPAMSDFRKYGFDAAMTKPYTIEQMFKTIQDFCPGTGPV